MKKITFALSLLAALAFLGCDDSTKAAIKSGVQAQGQDIVNETAAKATSELIQGKSLDEVKKNIGKNAKESAKQKAKDKLKEIDENVTGGVGSAIYEAQKAQQ